MAIDIKSLNKGQRRISLAKTGSSIEAPDLLMVQMESFKDFLQEDTTPANRKDIGIQSVFLRNFPLTDSRETALLEFIEYAIEKPQYSIRECQEQGLTYQVSLKAKLRLSTKPKPVGEGLRGACCINHETLYIVFLKGPVEKVEVIKQAAFPTSLRIA